MLEEIGNINERCYEVRNNLTEDWVYEVSASEEGIQHIVQTEDRFPISGMVLLMLH